MIRKNRDGMGGKNMDCSYRSACLPKCMEHGHMQGDDKKQKACEKPAACLAYNHPELYGNHRPV